MSFFATLACHCDCLCHNCAFHLAQHALHCSFTDKSDILSQTPAIILALHRVLSVPLSRVPLIIVFPKLEGGQLLCPVVSQVWLGDSLAGRWRA